MQQQQGRQKESKAHDLSKLRAHLAALPAITRDAFHQSRLLRALSSLASDTCKDGVSRVRMRERQVAAD